MEKTDEIKDISIKSLESILNSIDAMIYATVPDTGEILFVNKQLKQYFGKEDDDFSGQFCYRLLRKFDEMCPFCPCFHLEKDPERIFMWDEYVEEFKLHIRHSDILIDWPNGKKVHLQHAVDITELTNARELAEKSSKSKSIFLSHMSHEIRTPMNAILGIAEIQLQKENLHPDTCEAFGKIYESGDLLLNIINDLLDLSKIESGKLEIFPIKYDIPSLINDTTQLNRLRYESKPIDFSIQLDKKTPLKLFGDVLRIKQILNNILSNAFKYTDEGKIDFSIFCEYENNADDVTLVFSVSDTGQGMSKEQIEKLFDEYSRFNLDKNRTTVGSGLGMSITKRLVDLMNGEIFIKSEADKGSVFTVRLPQKRAGNEICTDALINKLKNFTFHSTSIMKKVQFLREYMPYGRVLVVDDVESNIYVARGMMVPYGLKIDTSSSGFDAIEKIKNGNVYDIIFMDHMMPGMDGIETVKNIREMGYKNPIIALTANAIIGRAKMFLQNGFDSFLSKPVDSRELDYLLNDFIKNRKPCDIVEAARAVPLNERILNNDAKSTAVKENEIHKYFVLDAENAVNVLEKINLNDSEIENYITAVHGMKSALANIGENELSAIALKLENAGKRWDFDALSLETTAFINALKSLILKYKSAQETVSGEISPEDTEYLQKKLAQIKTACLNLDKRTAKKAINEIKNTIWPKKIKIFIDELFIHLLHSDFKEIIKLADDFNK